MNIDAHTAVANDKQLIHLWSVGLQAAGDHSCAAVDDMNGVSSSRQAAISLVLRVRAGVSGTADEANELIDNPSAADATLSAYGRDALAILLRRAGRYTEALACQTPNITGSAMEREAPARAMTHTGLGLSLAALNAPHEALAHFYQAVACAREGGIAMMIANTEANLGGALYDLHSFDDAVEPLRKAQTLAAESENWLVWSAATVNRLMVELARNQRAEATELSNALTARWSVVPLNKRRKYAVYLALCALQNEDLKKAHELIDAHAINAMDAQPEELVLLAELALREGDVAKARQQCAQLPPPENAGPEQHYPYDRMRVWQCAARAAEAMGNYQDALLCTKSAQQCYEAMVGRSARAKQVTVQFDQSLRDAQQAQARAEADGQRYAELNAALQKANAAKSRFLAAASHDLRQPLQAVILFAEQLGVGDPTASPALFQTKSRITTALTALAGLVDQVLDFAALDSEDGSTAPPSTVSLVAVLSELDDQWYSQFERGGLKLGLHCPDVWASVDHLALTRILNNLLANALSFTQNGGALLAVRQRGDRLLVEVWDSGVGIPVNEQAQIFEPFFQINNPERDRARGVGLGLAIVKRLCERAGIALELRSRVGKGTCFRLTLPRAVKPADASILDLAAPPAVRWPETIRMVWLIEDDQLASMAIIACIEGFGANVRRFANLDAVLTLGQIHERDLPHLVIADHRLPDGSGLTAIQHIRQFSTRPIPTIMLTGDTAPPSIAQSIVLTKPVSGQTLCEAASASLRGDN